MRQESLPPHELAPALMKRGRGLKRLWDNLMAQPSAGARVDEARARIETMMVISWVVILSVAPALMKRGRGLKPVYVAPRLRQWYSLAPRKRVRLP